MEKTKINSGNNKIRINKFYVVRFMTYVHRVVALIARLIYNTEYSYL